jgi:dolichol-phosphate mannosyltransferase
MARVSLILPFDSETLPDTSRIEAARLALEATGHDVEVVVASGPTFSATTPNWHDSWRWEPVRDAGRAAAAVCGLERAHGEILVAFDPDLGYGPDDLVRVVDALVDGRGDLVVASRMTSGPDCPPVGRLRRGIGALARTVTGSSDPLSGLIGITRSALGNSGGHFMAVGSQFSLELLAKVRGIRVDVPARPGPVARRDRPGLDELRHIKRLADHRYGNLSRLIQFCVVGASGMVVDLSFYAAFQAIFARTALANIKTVVGQLDLAVSGVLAIAVALCWNFSLNRRLTFSYARHGSIMGQFVTYVLSNAMAITVSLALRLMLPRYVGFFDHHRLAAALVGIIVATGISFSMSRWVVFSPRKNAARAASAAQTMPQNTV